MVYDFREFRTSIYDRRGRAVIRNATAKYTVLDPAQYPERKVTAYDVSDAVPFGGVQLGPKERHGSSVKVPRIDIPTDPKDRSYHDWDAYRSFIAEMGREVSMIVSAGGALGAFEQRFVGFSKRDFLLIYSSFSAGRPFKCPMKLQRLSPLEVDGAKQSWSRVRSGLFVAGSPDHTDVQVPNPLFQLVLDLHSPRFLFTGVLRGPQDVPERKIGTEPAECQVDAQSPQTTFAQPGQATRSVGSDKTEELSVGDRGRTGFSQWAVEEVFSGDGVILDTSATAYRMAVLYIDISGRSPEQVESEFRFYRDRFRPDNKLPAPSFDLPQPE